MKKRFYASTTSCRCSVAILLITMRRRKVMKEKYRMHQRAIEAYNDLRKRSTARYAEYEASICGTH
jgi:hypothetical protein